KPGAGSDAGYITDTHAVGDCGLPGNTSCDASCVRPVILNRESIKVLRPGVTIKDFGNNDFWRDVLAILIDVVRIAISYVALGESWRIAKTGRIEERM